jgi:hypothetical protein
MIAATKIELEDLLRLHERSLLPHERDILYSDLYFTVATAGTTSRRRIGNPEKLHRVQFVAQILRGSDTVTDHSALAAAGEPAVNLTDLLERLGAPPIYVANAIRQRHKAHGVLRRHQGTDFGRRLLDVLDDIATICSDIVLETRLSGSTVDLHVVRAMTQATREYYERERLKDQNVPLSLVIGMCFHIIARGAVDLS